jgi:hypothetical protein
LNDHGLIISRLRYAELLRRGLIDSRKYYDVLIQCRSHRYDELLRVFPSHSHNGKAG